jgi:two-component system CheB/CheR fusion protein
MSAPPDPRSPPNVVVLCATASSPSGIAGYLRRLNSPPETAQVLVVGEELDLTALAAALSESGREIIPVTDGIELERGNIYVPPAHTIVALEDGKFRLSPAPDRPDDDGTIDSFLISMGKAAHVHIITADTKSEET